MNWRFLLLFLVGLLSTTLYAAPTYSIKPLDALEDELILSEKAAKASPAQRETYLKTLLFPQVQRDAAAGRQPAIWEIGFFYLNSWGVPRDLQKAEAAFRIGLQHRQGYGAYRLAGACRYEASKSQLAERLAYVAQAENLYREALEAGCLEAADGLVEVASAHLGGAWGMKADREAAEKLLEIAGRLAPRKLVYFQDMAEIRYEQKNYAQAYELATCAQEKENKNAPSAFSYRINGIRLISALRSGRFAQLPKEEALRLLAIQLDFLGPRAKAIPLLVVLELAGLVYWTYRARDPGPGWGLSGIWIGSAALMAGLGFQLSLPGFNQTAGRWFGAILITLAALTNLWLAGPKRYLGSHLESQALEPRKWLKTGGILLAILIGMGVANHLYSRFYYWLTGEKLADQMVALLLGCENPGQFLLLLLVAGVAVPFYEELFFRGYLYGAIERARGGIWALALSSLIFTLVHGLSHAPLILALALPLGYFRYRSGNLRLSFLLHCLNNSVGVSLFYVTAFLEKH